MNHVELTARIAEASPLRYTPAGIPAANFVLEHASELVESGVTRQVKLTVKALAFGTLAEQTGRLALGKSFRFTGFLVNARGSKGVVFHIQAFYPVSEQVLNPL
ncbi:MAG: primosomal replication protein N [Polaromonas sp.]|uniref:primosomal replication protein N n=1 Tax=Polaromonas sp. TaxID=1869339 RepID=UPI002735E155|nr:primosomal replication protein N [Polaromonas sp.]MDP2817877.1 primosomal replication protein N [Polaromonas sp.]